MFSECCVVFASFDVVFYEFDNGVWDVCVCGSFLVNMCIFTVSKAMLMSRATVIRRAGGIICLNPNYCVGDVV